MFLRWASRAELDPPLGTIPPLWDNGEEPDPGNPWIDNVFCALERGVLFEGSGRELKVDDILFDCG